MHGVHTWLARCHNHFLSVQIIGVHAHVTIDIILKNLMPVCGFLYTAEKICKSIVPVCWALYTVEKIVVLHVKKLVYRGGLCEM